MSSTNPMITKHRLSDVTELDTGQHEPALGSGDGGGPASESWDSRGSGGCRRRMRSSSGSRVLWLPSLANRVQLSPSRTAIYQAK